MNVPYSLSTDPPLTHPSAYDTIGVHYRWHQQQHGPGYRPTLRDLMETTGLSRTSCRVHRRAWERTEQKSRGPHPALVGHPSPALRERGV